MYCKASAAVTVLCNVVCVHLSLFGSSALHIQRLCVYGGLVLTELSAAREGTTLLYSRQHAFKYRLLRSCCEAQELCCGV